MSQGQLQVGHGALYNASVVFAADGLPIGDPQRQLYPIYDERGFIQPGDENVVSVVDTPAGRLGVLVGSDNGDPDNWLNVLFGCDSLAGNNFSKWCDKKFDGIVKEAKATSDVAKRTELYKQAQHILKDAVPMTPIAHSTVYQPMRNTVQDFKISPFGLNSFYGVSVSGK